MSDERYYIRDANGLTRLWCPACKTSYLSREGHTCMRNDPIFTAAEKERLFNGYGGELLHPSTRRFLDLLEECKALSLAKSADYGRDDDPDANLKNGQAFGIPNWIAVTCRMDDKLSRIKTAARQRLSTGEVHLQNEGLIDSLRDLAVYALKAIIRIEEEGT